MRHARQGWIAAVQATLLAFGLAVAAHAQLHFWPVPAVEDEITLDVV